jgi:hypothetical protein
MYGLVIEEEVKAPESQFIEETMGHFAQSAISAHEAGRTSTIFGHNLYQLYRVSNGKACRSPNSSTMAQNGEVINWHWPKSTNRGGEHGDSAAPELGHARNRGQCEHVSHAHYSVHRFVAIMLHNLLWPNGVAEQRVLIGEAQRIMRQNL